jgi:hypothetical protein
LARCSSIAAANSAPLPGGGRAGRLEPFRHRRIGADLAHVGGDARLQALRHAAPAVDAVDAVEGELGKTGLLRRRHIGRERRARAVGDHQEFAAAGLHLRQQQRDAGGEKLHPPGGEILERRAKSRGRRSA